MLTCSIYLTSRYKELIVTMASLYRHSVGGYKTVKNNQAYGRSFQIKIPLKRTPPNKVN